MIKIIFATLIILILLLVYSIYYVDSRLKIQKMKEIISTLKNDKFATLDKSRDYISTRCVFAEHLPNYINKKYAPRTYKKMTNDKLINDDEISIVPFKMECGKQTSMSRAGQFGMTAGMEYIQYLHKNMR